jgi:hypothetical protein
MTLIIKSIWSYSMLKGAAVGSPTWSTLAIAAVSKLPSSAAG